MQYVYIMCSRRRAVAISQRLKAQFADAAIVKAGGTDKLEIGYIVLMFVGCIPDSLPPCLDVNNEVLDFAVYEEKKLCNRYADLLQ